MDDKSKRDAASRDEQKEDVAPSKQEHCDLKDDDLDKVSGGIGFLKDEAAILVNFTSGKI